MVVKGEVHVRIEFFKYSQGGNVTQYVLTSLAAELQSHMTTTFE